MNILGFKPDAKKPKPGAKKTNATSQAEKKATKAKAKAKAKTGGCEFC